MTTAGGSLAGADVINGRTGRDILLLEDCPVNKSCDSGFFIAIYRIRVVNPVSVVNI
jgi:hypothetical protein